MIYTYQQAEEFLNQFILPPEPVTNPDSFLDRFKLFLKMLGNPHTQFQSVIVSGTSGKGSTSFILSSLLTNAGYKTGYTQSPHLERLTERLQINNTHMFNEVFVAMVNEIMPIIEAMKTTNYGSPSYYEILLGMSFLYFAKERVDIAVVEVGLEGKYDGTNVLSPVGFVLTNISLDHTNLLGNTIEQIADEATYKIKSLQLQMESDQKPFVITGVTQPSVVQLIQKRAEESGSKLLLLGRDFGYTVKESSKNGCVFSYDDILHKKTIRDLHISLVGEYQAENASVAIAAIIALREFGVKVSEETVSYTLSHVFFPGRFEIQEVHIRKTPATIVLDGAHNSAKMQAFLTSFKKFFSKRKAICIAAFSQGHDVEDMICQIDDVADIIILTQYGVVTDMGKKRSVGLSQLEKDAKKQLKNQQVFVEGSPENALQRAIEIGKKISTEQPEEPLLVVTGSLYLVGEVRQLLHLSSS